MSECGREGGIGGRFGFPPEIFGFPPEMFGILPEFFGGLFCWFKKCESLSVCGNMRAE